jgi:hypothetical protein
VLTSPDDLDGREALLEVLGDSEAMRRLVEAEAQLPPAKSCRVSTP